MFHRAQGVVEHGHDRRIDLGAGKHASLIIIRPRRCTDGRRKTAIGMLVNQLQNDGDGFESFIGVGLQRRHDTQWMNITVSRTILLALSQIDLVAFVVDAKLFERPLCPLRTNRRPLKKRWYGATRQPYSAAIAVAVSSW
jgi:hypothetical protein